MKVIKNGKILIVVLAMVFVLGIVSVVRAEVNLTKPLDRAGAGMFAGEGDRSNLTAHADATILVGRLIRAFITFLGVYFVVMVVWGGYEWMTAGGDSDKAKKARSRLTNAVIGMAIAVSWWVITDFVFMKLDGNPDQNSEVVTDENGNGFLIDDAPWDVGVRNPIQGMTGGPDGVSARGDYYQGDNP